MPHVIVKLWPGKSEKQKGITSAVTDVLHYGDESVSVGFDEVSAEDWAEKVYRPDIVNTTNKLYKKPGYRMYTMREKTPLRGDFMKTSILMLALLPSPFHLRRGHKTCRMALPTSTKAIR